MAVIFNVILETISRSYKIKSHRHNSIEDILTLNYCKYHMSIGGYMKNEFFK